MLMKRLAAFSARTGIYNLISLFNVLCGLSVTALVWYRYSASRESDILLLAISSIGIVSQLSLLGVEQVMYFYAEEKKRGEEHSESFFKLSFTWAFASGLIFIALFILVSDLFVSLVAAGLSADEQSQVRHLLLCLSPQLILSPVLHVLRGKLAIEEKFGKAYMLSAVNSFIVLLCLILVTVFQSADLKTFGSVVFCGFMVFILGFCIRFRQNLIRPSRQGIARIRGLVLHSSSIKGANAVHNFLVQALLSAILSRMPAGSISIFQYAKRLADGVFAITAGPQVMIYHSRSATAVPGRDYVQMKGNIFSFLKSFLTLFFAMAVLVYFAAPIALSLIGKGFSEDVIDQIRYVYVATVVWYLIIGIETMSVGVILALRSSLALLAVNFTFIVCFFSWSRLTSIHSVLQLMGGTVCFQVLSFLLFTLAAVFLLRRKEPHAG
jgi:hypothetical protein